jgi:plastocyanin
MRLKNLILGSAVVLLFAGVFIQASRNVSAATKTINIDGNLFSPLNQIIAVGDQILFENEDFVPHVLEIRRATDSGLIHTENFAAKTAETKDTYSRTFGVVGDFNLILDTNVATGSVTVLQATPSPTVSPSPTASPEPTVSSSPTPTVTPSSSATASPTPTLSPTPTVTVAPTVSPTATPTSSPSPTVAPTVTASPTVAPTVIASPTMSPTPVPSVTVTPTASPSPTVAPTATPTPSAPSAPLPAVLPGFSVFRSTACTAQINTGNTQVLTDKLSSIYMTRGYWNVTSITPVNNGISLSAVLYQVQKINLLFGGNPFFGGNRVTLANETAVFEGTTVPVVLQKASSAWCLR